MKKKIKYQTFWVVYDHDGLAWEYQARITRNEAIKAFLKKIGELPFSWPFWYRRGWRVKKVGVVE